MNESGVLLLFFSLFFHVRAQEKPDPNAFLHPLHPSTTTIIGVFSVMFSCTFLLLAYARFCPGNTYPEDPSINNTDMIVRARPRFSGIDKTAIESLPFFNFSSLKGFKEGLECAICLSKFDDSDVLRLLPRCKHGFHVKCIDQWLESHSSCPICRNRFDSNSLFENHSNLSGNSNLELFVQRQQDHHGSHSLRFSAGSSEELLTQEDSNNFLHKFKHKIIFTDVAMKNRWSDVNPSDLLSLSTEMLRVMPSNRFSSESSSRRFHDQQIEKIKKDIERKRMFESKFRNNPASSSSNEPNPSAGIAIDPAEKRCMSEIISFSRFREFNAKSRTSSDCNNENEERIRGLWSPMVRHTVQWFFGGERKFQASENSRHSPTV